MPIELVEILALTLAAGLCIPLGGLLARIERISPRWLETELRHFIMAFGGGVLLAGVALVLVPEGVAGVRQPGLVVAWMLSGGIVFFLLERLLGLLHSSAPLLSAMLLDFVPETLALGGLFAINSSQAAFLALLIGLQNIPEGFNAYREMDGRRNGSRAGGRQQKPNGRKRRGLIIMCLVALLGPVVGSIGWLFFTDSQSLLSGIMLFAAGGILYLMFQDIAPQVRLRQHWAPPLGAVLGFVLALYGQLLLGP